MSLKEYVKNLIQVWKRLMSSMSKKKKFLKVYYSFERTNLEDLRGLNLTMNSLKKSGKA